MDTRQKNAWGHNVARFPDWEQSQSDLDRRRQLQQLLEQAGKGLARRATWDQYETNHDRRQPVVLEAVRTWADEFDPDESADNLLLWGAVGTGKDHLALAAVRTVLKHHAISCWWQNGRDLAAEWRNCIDGGGERGLMATLTKRTLLVLSDPLPPFEGLSNYQADMLYRVVRARTDNGLATICTLNVSSDQEADDRMGAPTWDRLTQDAWKIHCSWPTHRNPKKVIA